MRSGSRLLRVAAPAAFALLCALAPAALAQTTYTWHGRGLPIGTPPNQIPGDSWFNPNSWSPAGVPGPSDVAVLHNFDPPIGQPGLTHPRLYGQDVTVAEITFSTGRQDGQGVTLSNGTGAPTFTVTRAFSFSAGSVVAMTIVCAEACSGGISGNFPKSLAAATLVNRGTVTWADAQAFRLDNGHVFNHGTFVLAAGGVMVASGGGRFVNYGTLLKTGGGTTFMGGINPFENEGGVVRSEAGTLVLGSASGGWIGGWFRGASRIEGPGLVRVALNYAGTPWADTLTVAGPTEFTRDNRMTGRFAIQACDGCLRWTGGGPVGIPGGTLLTILPGSFVDLEPAASDGSTSVNGASITNLGTLRWRGPHALSWNAGELLNEGTLELHGDGMALAGGGALVNRGLLVRRGAGTTYLGGAGLTNEGATIRVEEGTLAASSSTGALVHTELFDGSRVEGAGLFRLHTLARAPWTGTTTVTGNLELAAGSFVGQFTLAACDGCLRWTGGSVFTHPGLTTMRIPPGGFLDVEGPADKAVAGATLLNAGTVRWHDGRILGNGTVVNEGRFEAARGEPFQVIFRQDTPGAEFVSAPGLDTLTVGQFHATDGHVELQVGPGGRSDRIVASQVTAGGSLIVTPGEPYTPAVGDAFTLTRSSSAMVGAFADVTGFGLNGASLTPSYTTQETRVTVGPPGGPALTVAPDPVQGGAVRTLNVGGTGFTAATTVRLECDGCADPANHSLIPATITNWTPTRLVVSVDLRAPDAYGGYDLVVAGGGDGAVGIVVLPIPLVVSLAVADGEAAEDGREPGRLTVTANRLNDVARPVNYALTGSAVLFTDYTTDTPLGRVVFPAGRRSVDVLIAPLQDAEAEPTETATLALTAGPSYGVTGPAAGTVTIADGRSASAYFVVTTQPASGGAGGSTVLSAVGQGITTGATIALQGPSARPGTSPTVNATGTMVTAVLDLDGAPTGAYDVVVTNGDGAMQTFPGAFTVEAPVPPELHVSVTGPPFFRSGQVSRYTVTVSNRGNVDAVAVPVWVAIDNAAGPVLEPAFELLPVLEPPEGFPGWDAVPLRVDTLGETTMPLFIPVIAGGESVTLAFNARTYRFSAWTTQPLLTSLAPGAAGTAALDDLVGDLTGWRGGTDVAWENCALNLASLALDLVPGIGCVTAAHNYVASVTINAYGAGMARARGDGYGAAGNLVQSMVGYVGLIGECAGSIVPAFRIVSVMAKVISGAVTLQACLNFFRKARGEDVNSSEVTATDPNDKLGPDGYGPERFRAGVDDYAYTIRFENMATATAPAAEVLVIDTLDTAVYDLSTFRLGAFAYGDSTLTLPPGLTSYAAESALPNGMLLQTSAQLDAATGRVVWRFTTLDPATRQPPQDPFLGFLPPNVTPPEGEGSVTFAVRPRPTLPDGVPIENRADIFFDFNDPIATPPWVNTLDRARPSSRVLPLAATQSDSAFTVRWGGDDAGAGVVAYDVYVQEDGGPFTRWLLNADTTAALYEGELNRTYGFYSIARDGAGNLEGPKTTAEATTQVAVGVEGGGSLPAAFSLEAARPNPVREGATLRYGLPVGARVILVVYDVLGREVARLLDGAERPAGWHEVPLDGRALAAGTYLYRMEAGDFTAVRRLTVTR